MIKYKELNNLLLDFIPERFIITWCKPDYNCGMFGLNWECITCYDSFYSKLFSVLRYNRNIPKRSINIDDFLHKEYHDEIKKLTDMNYQLAKETAIFILTSCYEFIQIGVLK